MNLLLPKLKPIRDRAYLDYLREQPCLFTEEMGCEPAHIGTLGKGIKRSDDEAIPLHWRLHRKGHQHSEVAMIREHIPDPAASWLVVLFCGGKGLPEWGKAGIPAIEDWARRCGCSGVEIVGRAGWAMALGYEKSATIIQKVLA